MKRSLSVFLAVLLALLCLCSAGCKEDDVDWVTGETYATSGSQSASPTSPSGSGTTALTGPSLEGSYPAPKFKAGKYSMVNGSTTLTEYLTDAGAVYYSESTLSQYTYGLDISEKADGFECIMSFDNIYISQTVSGSTTILLDTSTRDYLSASTEPYYDIIGLSFTVSIGADGSVTGISGVDELIAAFPNSAVLLDKENLLGVAQSFFYPIPDTFADGTAWTLEQYGLVNTYRVVSLARDRFGIAITGPEQQPFAYDTADGLTLNYSNVSALSGTLYMDVSNRALQEITSMQKSSGTITGTLDGQEISIPFNYNITSLTRVTEG